MAANIKSLARVKAIDLKEMARYPFKNSGRSSMLCPLEGLIWNYAVVWLISWLTAGIRFLAHLKLR